jgi:BirA family biotin operon repressor/biotin-[acetyl-CoA-carboxylase] ligase
LGTRPETVRKAITALQSAGFALQLHPFEGCQLIQETERLSAADVLSRRARPETWRLEVHEKTESTNDLGLQHGRSGGPLPCAFLAEEQTAGRGRLGRNWVSDKSASLCLSAVLIPRLPTPLWHHLAALAAVAVARAIASVHGLRVGIKWPNDLFFAGKKLGGILVESVVQKNSRSFAVIGIGLNVHRISFPPDLEHRSTSLEAESGVHAARSALAAAILDQLDALEPVGPAEVPAVLEEFRSRNIVLGKQISALSGDGRRIEGIAEEIDADGHLLVRTAPGAVEKISSGEISLHGWRP